MAYQEFTASDLGSYYQARVAPVFVKRAIADMAVTDPDLEDDLHKVSEHFLKAVQDSAAFTEEQLRDPVILHRLYTIEETDRSERHEVFDALIQKYIHQPEKMRRFMDHIVRLGHIIKVASPQVHENAIDDARPIRDEIIAKQTVTAPSDFANGIPDSLEELILQIIKEGDIKTFAELRDAIAKAVVTSVSTSHPTRYLTPGFTELRQKFLLAQRELTRTVKQNQAALQAFINGEDKAYKALHQLLQEPITFTDEKGGPANMTPRGEILAGLSEARDDFTRNVDDIHRTFDDTLQRLSDKKLLPFEYGETERFVLTLSMIFETWIVGDKDGNNNIRSEHMPLAALIFESDIARLYAEQMQQSGFSLAGAPDGGNWTDYLTSKHAEINAIVEPLVQRIKEQGGTIDLPLSRQEFLELRDRLHSVYGNIDDVEASFKASLTEAYKVSEGENRKAALSLLRKARIYGLHFLKFHMREKADVHEIVVDNLFRENVGLFDSTIAYKSLDEKGKLAALNHAMAHPELLPDLKDSYFARQKREGKDSKQQREYSDAEPDVITTHTLQRFETAAVHKEMVTNHVLAECKGAREMMEVLLLGKICGVDFTIVPLVEERKTLTRIIPIFMDCFRQRAWRDYMWEKAGGGNDIENIEKIVDTIANIISLLKAMFAHSDNMRVMGLAAAKANIYEQANLLRRGVKEKLLPLMLRGYVKDGRIKQSDIPEIMRRLDKKQNAYDIKQFHGGSRCDTARGGVRSTVAFADDVNIHGHNENTLQGGDNAEIRLGDRLKRLMTTMIARSTLALVKQRHGNGRKWNAARESLVRRAADGTIRSYKASHYGRRFNQLGKAMAEAGLYAWNAAYNNPGSRGARNASGGIKAVELTMDAVDPSDMRTIGFTSTGIDEKVGFGVLGMRNAAGQLSGQYANDHSERAALQADAIKLYGQDAIVFENGNLTSVGFQTLYRTSRIDRAAIGDYPAFGSAISDVKLTSQVLRERKSRGGPEATKATLHYFESSLPKDIASSALLYLTAKGYEVPEEFIAKAELAKPTPETCRKLSFLVRKITMPHIDEQMGLGERMHHFGGLVREALVNDVWANKPEGQRKLDSDQAYMFRLTGILRSLFGHVLYDGVADIATGKMITQKRPQENWAPALRAASATP